MSVTVQDVLMVNVILPEFELLRTQEEVVSCSEAIGAEIVHEEGLASRGSALVPVARRTMKIPKNRLAFETSPLRTVIEREYPVTIDDVTSISHLASQVLGITNLGDDVPSAFGFNIHLVYDQSSGENAAHYLGRRIFASADDLGGQWNLSGGFGKMIFEEGTRRWVVTLEPRFNANDTTKVFLETNLHVSEHESRKKKSWDIFLQNFGCRCIL